ncbi:dipeptide ABC transporter ATP-binding protein [Lysinibacter cavernae]|uniref:Peptide/nickel transport system ATP-binding protein n=1 Tax=Lysinibacter cavernae TaxID=1640652 RepID=A0A7X5TTE1_9MICO|nr:ABC transporter ATP-binding protein [Lysinibacter cavernae]NIH52582.1 peptide/nickel transport system ATP-binding protein [Lysinibacter cavernae]
MTEPALRVRNLRVTFGAEAARPVPTAEGNSAVVAVRDVSFSVRRGEVLAIVGESGSGKSVTALSVLNLLPTTATRAGSITHDGRELTSLTPEQLSGIRGGTIAMVFQDATAALDPVFTAGSQLIETIRVHHPSLNKAEAQARALKLLADVELQDPELTLTQYPHQLSGGQCQRVVIAIALAGEPEILIADEPTTALDVTVQREILELLRRISVTTAVLLITHDMGVVADLADRVVVMRHGEVVETASVEDLFARPQADYTRTLLAAVLTPGTSAKDLRLDGASAVSSAPVGIDRTALHSIAAVRSADDSQTTTASVTSPTLALRDLTVRYHGTPGPSVNAVSLSILPGSIVGLVGESGSGKTSIGKAVLGLSPVSEGRIVLGGVDLNAARHRERRRLRQQIGVVFQSPSGSLDPRRTIGSSIAEPFSATGRRNRAEESRRVAELLDLVRLPASWHSRFPHELSGGQKQRVAIARALALRPELLIADEPTSALDVSVQAEILDLLSALHSEWSFSCLFISHDLAVIDRLCDRVVVLRDGAIVEQGATERILSAPQHEYTKALLASAPVADPAAQRARRAEHNRSDKRELQPTPA